MSKNNGIEENPYIVTRIFERSNKSILDLMLEHYVQCWEKDMTEDVNITVEEQKKTSKITL